jgi:hypothetical protein
VSLYTSNVTVSSFDLRSCVHALVNLRITLIWLDRSTFLCRRLRYSVVGAPVHWQKPLQLHISYSCRGNLVMLSSEAPGRIADPQVHMNFLLTMPPPSQWLLRLAQATHCSRGLHNLTKCSVVPLHQIVCVFKTVDL